MKTLQQASGIIRAEYRHSPRNDGACATRILLIEEDEDRAASVVRALRAEGAEVVTCHAEPPRRTYADEPPIDLVLLGHRLPNVTGVDILRQLREGGIRAPFMFMEGDATDRGILDAVRVGTSIALERAVNADQLNGSGHRPSVRPSPAAAGWRDGAAIHSAEGGIYITRPPGSTAERWAGMVLKMVEAPGDTRTIASWARAANVSRSVLAECCRLIRVSPHDARDFARMLRAICRSGPFWRPEEVMDVADSRTLRKLLMRAGLIDATRTPTVESFLENQRWVSQDNAGLVALRSLMCGEH